MGIGFVMMFWTALGSIILASYLLLSRSRENSSRALSLKKALAIFSVVVGIPIALLVAVNIPGFFPGHVFESSFGFAPTPDVTELKGVKSTFGDSDSAYLRFRANKQTIERIIGSRFFETDENGFRNRAASALNSAPSYWRPFEGKPTRFYETYGFNGEFGSSNAILCYDESSGIAHFYWIGAD